MAHGSPTIHKCDDCKQYGMMPRFGSHRMKYLCPCGKKTTPTTRLEGEQLQYDWIGWWSALDFRRLTPKQ